MSAKIKHGMSNTRIYYIWQNMNKRCNDGKRYNYGERGITVCDSWKKSFINFYSWAISSNYTDNLELDRKDNNGNYTPENCRWITESLQSRNRSKFRNCTSKYIGVFKNAKCSTWTATLYGVPDIKNGYIGSFKTEVEAAKAYDELSIKYFGVNANLNFPRNA